MEAPLAFLALVSIVFGIVCLFKRAKVEKDCFKATTDLRRALGKLDTATDLCHRHAADAALWAGRFSVIGDEFLAVDPRNRGFREEDAKVTVGNDGKARWTFADKDGNFILNSHPKYFANTVSALQHFRHCFPQSGTSFNALEDIVKMSVAVVAKYKEIVRK